MRLPESIDEAKVNAKFEKGVLKISAAKKPEAVKVERKIVAINGITDQVLFEITGLCSITRDGDLVVVCRKGPNEYEKHYVGLSQNVTFISTQLRTLDVDRYQTKIVFRPTSIVPDYDLSVGAS